MIHVCSLARLHDTVRETGARHVVTLIKDITLVHRPPSITADNHLLLDMDDIAEPIEGYVVPAEEHGADLLRFGRAWPREAHFGPNRWCRAGSRCKMPTPPIRLWRAARSSGVRS